MNERIKWNGSIEDRRVELLCEGFSYSEVALVLSEEFNLNVTRSKVLDRSRRTNTLKSQVLESKTSSISTEETLNKSLFPNEVYGQDESITFAPEKKRILNTIWESFNDGKSKKILSLSDLHAPYMDFEAVEKALIEHSDADILVLNGDVFDGQALSDYDKLNDFDIEIEFEQVFILLDTVTKMFEKIYWVGGNHDLSRFMRMVARKFGQGLKKYVMKRLNPIEYIAEKYDNLTVVPHQFMQAGKCIFVHPDGYSSALMSTAIKQTEIFEANKEELLPHQEFQCVVQGHTHDLGEYYYNGVKVIEQGYLSYTQDYRFDKPVKRRNTKGYAVIHLDEEGNVNFNKTHAYYV